MSHSKGRRLPIVDRNDTKISAIKLITAATIWFSVKDSDSYDIDKESGKEFTYNYAAKTHRGGEQTLVCFCSLFLGYGPHGEDRYEHYYDYKKRTENGIKSCIAAFKAVVCKHYA